jgi:hypothetical protein
MASENYGRNICKLLILNGGQRRDRTADAGLFRAGVLDNYERVYQANLAKKMGRTQR